MDVREHCAVNAPELLYLLDIYAAEATFGRNYISSDIKLLKKGDRILEVGAGSFLLSCQLVREGFDVTALEPIGPGFSHFEQLRTLVFNKAHLLGCQPRTLNMPAEEFTEKNNYSFAFSINVMEHVINVPKVLINICESLVLGASYRFTCPNYLFPYEPHFNIPTLYSKKITQYVFAKKIINMKGMLDPEGAWHSLNWINVLQIRRSSAKIKGIRTTFSTNLIVNTLERIALDKNFASRRSHAIQKTLLFFVKIRLHRLFILIPPELQPIIDCRLHKTHPKD